ncbi:unnamed protein product, partial [Aphanomyces euteiches]
QFVVDLFKILKWVLPIEEPNALMHLFPQTGLFKKFRENAEIDMDIIQRIYSADLQHVERGICNHISVTVPSIGQTLQNALVDFQGNRDLIIDQVKECSGDLEHCRPLDAPPPKVKRFPKNKSCKTALELDDYQFGVFVDELAQM